MIERNLGLDAQAERRLRSPIDARAKLVSATPRAVALEFDAKTDDERRATVGLHAELRAR